MCQYLPVQSGNCDAPALVSDNLRALEVRGDPTALNEFNDKCQFPGTLLLALIQHLH